MAGSAFKPADDEEPVLDELRAILDEELARLPEQYRGAVVLCELDGLSRRAAARRLGIPEGTLSSRLARAKELLRHRLVRRGLALSALALDGALAREAQARTLLVPFSLVDSTIRSAACVAAGASLAEAATTSVATLTQGVLKAMLLAQFKGIALGLATATVLTTGVVLAQVGGTGFGPPARPRDQDRLGVLERKLDRILEALGSSRGVATARAAPIAAAAPKDVAGFPDAQDVPQGGPPIGVDAAPKGVGPFTGADHAPRAKGAGLVPYDRGWVRGKAARATTAPDGPSRTLATRVDALEQRLADLERRFGAMEQRLARPGPLPAASPTPAPRAQPGPRPAASPTPAPSTRDSENPFAEQEPTPSDPETRGSDTAPPKEEGPRPF
jgi:hypothetical protein